MDGPADPLLQRLFAHWQRLRGGRPMPARADLDPTEMPDLLPHLLLVEVRDGPKRFHYRLTGTWVDTIYGTCFTGTWLEDLDPDRSRDYWLAQYRQAAAQRAPLWGSTAEGDLERGHKHCHWLMLPLSAETAGGLMILVGVAFY